MPQQFLFEKLDAARQFSTTTYEVPTYITNNLAKNVILRDYQVDALHNTTIYLNSPEGQARQTNLLYSMATGSGKTVIMAALILAYYKKGYRNFFFFTRQNSVIAKTKANFIKAYGSSKFLFADKVEIDGKNVPIREVNSFQTSDKDAINICFSSVSGIAYALADIVHEGEMEIKDFQDHKVVLIADEAHHLNSHTKKDPEIEQDNANWEDATNKMFSANKENVLLEFTATPNLEDENVKAKYLDKIVFDFKLDKFREAGYTKEFSNLQSTFDPWLRTIQALIISEFRKLLFEAHNSKILPVVLLQFHLIKECDDFYKAFFQKLKTLQPQDIAKIEAAGNENTYVKNAFAYFKSISLSNEKLIDLLKIDFAKEHAINMNQEDESVDQQIISLDEPNNNIRLIFTVIKLTEGWDVLSLFDIVREYETRQSLSGGKVSDYTMSEAQLIGRGARYCPFSFHDGQVEYLRKYDNDWDNPEEICEALLYHCKQDSRYIDEIKKALQQIGLTPKQEQIKVVYRLKDKFKETQLYLNGSIFLNNQIEVSRDTVHSLPVDVRSKPINFYCGNSKSFSSLLFIEKSDQVTEFKEWSKRESGVVRIKEIDLSILYKAVRCFETTLNFERLLKFFPHLSSMEDFLISDNYAGNIPVTFFVCQDQDPSREDYLAAAKIAFQRISDYISTIKVNYQGTKIFKAYPIREKFTNRTRIGHRDPDDESWGFGIPQSDPLCGSYRMTLSDKDWFAYEENYGTSEEKKFVKYFSTIVDDIKTKYGYKKAVLIRNEIQVAIYNFEDGKKFMPDYVLLLSKPLKDNDGNKSIEIFAEPKGAHLLQQDAWKGDLLKSLEKEAITEKPTIYVDNNDYKIWGLPLYNETVTKEEVDKYLKALLDSNK